MDPKDTKNAPAEEAKDTKVETKTEEAPKEEPKDVKIGDALKTKEEPKKEPKMVPEAVFLELKKDNKELAKKIDELIQSGASKKEVAADLKTLADEFGVDEGLVNGVASFVKKGIEADLEAKNRPIVEKQQAEEREKVFNEHYEKTLEKLPEYSKIVSKEVIKSLAFDPKNANKTFDQIFEESYGHLVTGKKTLESTKPRGGVEDTSVDLNRAGRDAEYFKEIMADPELKKKYNEGMAKRNGF